MDNVPCSCTIYLWMVKERMGLMEEPIESILDEAKRITGGDRQAAYGSPDQDFARTAIMWNVLLTPYIKDGKLEMPPKAVAAAMIALKLSRDTHMSKRDNAVDIAGYAHCMQICVDVASARSD